MRVLLAGPYPSDPGEPHGGVEASFVNLVEGLASLRELDLHVVTFAPGAAENRSTRSGTVPIEILRTRSRLNALDLHRSARRSFAAALERLRPDVVHAQDTLGYGFVCLRTAGRAPVVVSIHGIVRETWRYERAGVGRIEVATAGVALERYCIRHARYLVQPTRYPERYFGGEIRGRIVEVGNAVAEAVFSSEPAPQPGRILVAGAVSEGKRVADAVEALAEVRRQLPDAKLRIAGNADPAYAALLRGRIDSHGLGPHVELLGELTAGELLEEYRRAAVVLHASAQETSPMVIAEAMAAGVPVVATRVGGVPELVEDGVTGRLVQVGNVAGMARALTTILGDEAQRERLATNARRLADRFRPSHVAANVRAVYEDAVFEPPQVSARF